MSTPRSRSSCGDSNPLRDVFAIQRGVTTATAADVKGTEQEEEPDDWEKGDVTVMYDKGAGTQIIQHQESVTDCCSMSPECSLEPPGPDWSSVTALGSPGSHSRLSLPAEPGRKASQEALPPRDPDQDPVGTDKPVGAQLQAFTVLSVNGTLWIPRYEARRPRGAGGFTVSKRMTSAVFSGRRGGDVMVIEIQSGSNQLRGRVIAVLSPPSSSSLG